LNDFPKAAVKRLSRVRFTGDRLQAGDRGERREHGHEIQFEFCISASDEFPAKKRFVDQRGREVLSVMRFDKSRSNHSLGSSHLENYFARSAIAEFDPFILASNMSELPALAG
jgi:hypothetical protein